VRLFVCLSVDTNAWQWEEDVTELIWDGKYTADGKRVAPLRVALPFQTVETVNESAQQRQLALDFFARGREAVWRNRLIWGDKKYVLPSLLPEFAGRVDLIYIDPPFDTGADFSFTTRVPDSDASFTKEPSIIEQKAYRDTWGRGLDSYLQWFYETAVLLYELLNDEGTIYVHIGSNVSHYVKVLMDFVFGPEAYINEVVWKRNEAHSDVGQGAQHFGRLHDILLVYGKSSQHTWNQLYEQHSAGYLATHYSNIEPETGRRYELDNLTGPGGAAKGNPAYAVMGITRHWRYSQQRMQDLIAAGRVVQPSSGAVPRYKRYLDESKGRPLQDIWSDVPPVNSQAQERLGYATQKPEALLERIIKASSNEGDFVLDCFCGSGTTAAVAEKLGRRWIAADLGRFAIQTTRKRLLSIPSVRPFVVQNLGKYERQAWQAAEFQGQGRQDAGAPRGAGASGEAVRQAAYRRFILDLYHADPLLGYTWLHGLKNGRFVHVGSVDAPVTAEDVKAIARECWKAGGYTAGRQDAGGPRNTSNAAGRQDAGGPRDTSNAADVLGWDFAFEVNETAKAIAAEANVRLAFKRIPREVLEKKAVE
jgi:DNA modification methylase